MLLLVVPMCPLFCVAERTIRLSLVSGIVAHYFAVKSRSTINRQKTFVAFPVNVLIRSSGTPHQRRLFFDALLAETTLIVTK